MSTNDNVNTSADAEKNANPDTKNSNPGETNPPAETGKKNASEGKNTQKDAEKNANPPAEKKFPVKLLSRTGFGERGEIVEVTEDVYKAYGPTILQKNPKKEQENDE